MSLIWNDKPDTPAMRFESSGRTFFWYENKVYTSDGDDVGTLDQMAPSLESISSIEVIQ